MIPFSRRHFIRSSATLLGAAVLSDALWAEVLYRRTPWQTEGPFYPDRLPLDTDNDLLIVNDNIGQAVGQVTHVKGQVMDVRGNPIKDALVEIWQVNVHGRYIHTSDNRHQKDPNFQGYGRFETGSKGAYYFRTIKPVHYSGRAPHIHFAITAKDYDPLTTQMYVAGEPRNRWDRPLNGVQDPEARRSLIVDLKPVPDSEVGELAGTFNIVLG